MTIENKLKNIPHLYYVNLDERTDRKQYMETQFKKWGIENFTRISASKFLVSEKENWKHLVIGDTTNSFSYAVAHAITHFDFLKDWLNETTDEYLILMEDDYDFIFNSMPIDQYYDYQFGELPYRSIKFENVSLPTPKALPVATVNFTHNGPYTRVTEWKNIPNHGIDDAHTTLTYEMPCDYKDNNLERYYPVKDKDGNKDNYIYIGLTCNPTKRNINHTKVLSRLQGLNLNNEEFKFMTKFKIRSSN